MYFDVIWEYVNSIFTFDTCIFVPNLGVTSFLVMYNDVLKWTIIHRFQREDLGGTLARATARSSIVARKISSNELERSRYT